MSEGYQPIPIKVSNRFFPKCPNENELFVKRGEAIAARASVLEAEQQTFMTKITKIFKLPLTDANIGIMLELYDVVTSDQNLGRPMPSNFTDAEYKQLKYIYNYLFVLLYADHLAAIYSTPIVKPILENMESIINGNFGQKKLTVISGHDSNVAPVLTFMNLTSSECIKKKWNNQTITENCAEPVPFASSLQFELHQKDSSH